MNKLILVFIIISIISIICIFLNIEYFSQIPECPNLKTLTCSDNFVSKIDISDAYAQKCIPNNFIHYNNKICSCNSAKKISLEKNNNKDIKNLAICENGLKAQAKQLKGYLPWNCNKNISPNIKIAKNIGVNDIINLYCR
jgi:hypothetical protein